jgi:hypothetical protein
MGVTRAVAGQSYLRLVNLLLFCLVFGLGNAAAQTYPDKLKLIRLVVPFNAPDGYSLLLTTLSTRSSMLSNAPISRSGARPCGPQTSDRSSEHL